MNLQAKQLFLAEAKKLSLDACGVCNASMDEALSEILRAAGAVPFAPEATQRLDASALLPGSQSVMVILFPYKPQEIEEGNIALYARPRDYHKINHQYLAKLIGAMKAAYPKEEFLPLVDTSPLVDRWLAYQAGLGFFGKNHCLIHPRYGSYVTIGAILTTLAMPADSPLSLSCGDCRLCLSHCPGHAISETRLTPWRCKSYLTQKKEELTEEEIQILTATPYIFGCDECQRHCPYNETALPSPLPEIQKERIPSLSLEDLTACSNRSFEKLYKDYAFAWRGRKVLLRNGELLEKRDKG